MKKLICALLTVMCLTGCPDTYVDTITPLLQSHPLYGCVVIADEYGEREVCNVHYYYHNGIAYYWDANFGVWIGGGGYWHRGVWYRGYRPGYYNHYRGFYQPRGFYHHGGHHR